jgi:hypothetical protein
VSGPVEKQHLCAAFEQGPERDHLVIQIGARAMDKDERWKVSLGSGGHIDIMQLRSVSLNERSNRRILPRNPCRPDTGQNKKNEE